MYKKIRNCIINIFNLLCLIFTFNMILFAIGNAFSENSKLDAVDLLYCLVVCLILAILAYILWYSDLSKNLSYKWKNVIQYVLGLILYFYCYDVQLNQFFLILKRFIAYNICYFIIVFIDKSKFNMEVEKLNKVILNLKEKDDK